MNWFSFRIHLWILISQCICNPIFFWMRNLKFEIILLQGIFLHFPTLILHQILFQCFLWILQCQTHINCLANFRNLPLSQNIFQVLWLKVWYIYLLWFLSWISYNQQPDSTHPMCHKHSNPPLPMHIRFALNFLNLLLKFFRLINYKGFVSTKPFFVIVN